MIVLDTSNLSLTKRRYLGFSLAEPLFFQPALCAGCISGNHLEPKQRKYSNKRLYSIYIKEGHMFKITSTSNMKDGVNFGGMSTVHLDNKHRKEVDHKNEFINKSLTDLNQSKVYISSEKINEYYLDEIHKYNQKQIKNRHKEKVVDESDTDGYLKQFRKDKRRHNIAGATFDKSVVFQFGNTKTMFGEFNNSGERMPESAQNDNMRSFFESRGVSTQEFLNALSGSFLDYADHFNDKHTGLKLGQVFTNMDEGYPHMHAQVWITGKNRYNNLDPTFINAFKSELSPEEMKIVTKNTHGNRKLMPREIAKFWHKKDDEDRYRIFEKRLTELAKSHGISDFHMGLDRPSTRGVKTGIDLEELKGARTRMRDAQNAEKAIKIEVTNNIKNIDPEHVVELEFTSNPNQKETKVLDDAHEEVGTEKGFKQHLAMSLKYLTGVLMTSIKNIENKAKGKLLKTMAKISPEIKINVPVPNAIVGVKRPLTESMGLSEEITQTYLQKNMSLEEISDGFGDISKDKLDNLKKQKKDLHDLRLTMNKEILDSLIKMDPGLTYAISKGQPRVSLKEQEVREIAAANMSVSGLMDFARNRIVSGEVDLRSRKKKLHEREIEFSNREEDLENSTVIYNEYANVLANFFVKIGFPKDQAIEMLSKKEAVIYSHGMPKKVDTAEFLLNSLKEPRNFERYGNLKKDTLEELIRSPYIRKTEHWYKRADNNGRDNRGFDMDY